MLLSVELFSVISASVTNLFRFLAAETNTFTILVKGLPVGRLNRYIGNPTVKIKSAEAKITVQISKLELHPLFSSVQTIIVTAKRPPKQIEKKYQLKNPEISPCFRLSSWSPPWAGKEALTPPTPVATAYSPVNRTSDWRVEGVLSPWGCNLGVCAWMVNKIKPYRSIVLNLYMYKLLF